MSESVLGFQVESSESSWFAGELFRILFEETTRPRICTWLACLNPHSYAVARRDAAFSLALRDANWLVPDGTGIVFASAILGGSIRGRITGSDVFRGLHERMNVAGGTSVFFLGSTADTLRRIKRRMAEEYPRIRIAGSYSPAFKDSFCSRESEQMISTINAAAPDILWVGMTAPKQEKWICENRHYLNVRFAGAVGAVFDFYAGHVKRSHPVFQRLGFEWLPRLIQQPRRLWRRTFVSAPIFLLDVLRAKMLALRIAKK